MAAKHRIEELVDELEGELLRVDGRLRTLQGTTKPVFGARATAGLLPFRMLPM
jgi:hypothetical protein